MTTFDIYRLELSKDNLAAAVSDFKARRGTLPSGLTVHKSQVQNALTLLAGGVKLLPVSGSGGCLSTEFWLEHKNGKEK